MTGRKTYQIPPARSIYDRVENPPVYRKKLNAPYEELAQTLFHSGRMRIEADEYYNFARFTMPYHGINAMFSRKELNDPKLLPHTKARLKKLVASDSRVKNHDKKVDTEIARMRKQLQKRLAISEEKELWIARILVQCAHPSVIRLLLVERVEVYVSFAHDIGNLLDIASWQANGGNSGMQTTDGRRLGVYVSTGGDPFVSDKFKRHNHDGEHALCRMQIIAAQELAHYADITRNDSGQQIGRISANLACTRPTPEVNDARLADLKMIAQVEQTLYQLGLFELTRMESSIGFFRKHRKGSLVIPWTRFKTWLACQAFFGRCNQKGLYWVKQFPSKGGIATNIATALSDMKFNLAPVADVYSHPDKRVEDAIACAEALARVPQQEYKWGNFVVEKLYPRMRHIYYSQLIPSVEKTLTAYQR